MSENQTAQAVFDGQFLVVRAKLLEIAAALDRIDRAPGEPSDEARVAQIRAGIQTLLADGDDRAERIQQLFSLPYNEHWRQAFGLVEPAR